MPLQFIYRRKVLDNRIKVARITYTIDPPLPDNTHVMAIFSGCQQDGRSLGRCSVWHDSKFPLKQWPLNPVKPAEGTYEFHPDDR